MTLLDAILNDLRHAWLSFKIKWLESELEYLDWQENEHKRIIAEWDARSAVRGNRR